MDSVLATPRQSRWKSVVRTLGLAALISVPLATLDARQAKLDVLHVGTSGTLTAEKESSKEKGALQTLQRFIKDETGLTDEIVREKNWRDLADKMSKGTAQVGVFQGYEFAWAQELHADLKPMALAVNLYRYPIVYVVTLRTSEAKDFGGLQGQSLCLPDTGQPYLRLFVEKECQDKGKDMKSFFSKITTEQNVEDCLDDAVDGTVQVAVVDRAALEAYKQRKPGRFALLKEVDQSKPFPPAVIAYYDKKLDDATLKRFQDGLFGASKTEKGKTILTLFHLTGFDPVPDDFGKVLAETRKTYPPPKMETK